MKRLRRVKGEGVLKDEYRKNKVGGLLSSGFAVFVLLSHLDV